MDAFFLIVFGSLVVVVLVLLGLGIWSPRSVNELTGRADERRIAAQAEIEARDVTEMVDAHNEARRERGKAEVSEAEIRARADATQRDSIERAERPD